MFHPHSWTLRTRLITVMVALVAVTSVVIGGVMFFVIRQSQSDEFDQQVGNAGAHGAFQIGQSSSTSPDTDGDTPTGTLVVSVYPAPSAYILSASGAWTKLSTATQNSILSRLSGTDGFETISVPGYGSYRFSGPIGLGRSEFGGPVEVVAGLPLSILQARVAAVVGLIALIVLAAIVLAAIAGTLIVGRALRPLRRVAGIATDVSRMQLERGDVVLAERVPDSDTDSRTEVGQVGAALNNLLDSVGSALKVRQASEQKVRTFVADASHELRTPLASIRGYAELTRRFGGDLSDDARHNIDRIESETKRMTSLVEDLLLLARLDAQRELEAGEVDLSRLLVDVVSDAHAAGRDHSWELDLPEEPITIQGDDLRLHQVFANLLANARVHTPAGTSVTVSLDQERSGEVVVRVRDSGPGIPAELQPTLFERFVRGDSSRVRKTGSTGLGLSIVSAVVQAHNGSVAVESEPGSTVFTVRLPADPASSPAPTRSTAVAV